MIYKIYEITGEYAIPADSGQKIYSLIHPELLAGKPVELDFTGVKVFASAFFNFAIGQLLRDISAEDLNSLLQINELNDNGQKVLKSVIENAKHYYSDSIYRQAVDAVLEEYATSF